LTIILSFAADATKNKTNDNNKCREIAGNFDRHADAAVQCGGHRPVEHIQGFTRSYSMLPLGNCRHLITQAATMVNNFSC
jgi:hypothetical protein